MTTRRDSIARQTAAWLFTLSEDENLIFAELVDRVRKAVPQYGHVDIRTDKRDFRQERAAEVFDSLFYAGLEWLKRHVARVDAVTAPDAASVEELERGYVSSPAGTPANTGPRPASDARGLALSAPADTVVPHDGERMHGGNSCQGGETGSRGPVERDCLTTGDTQVAAQGTRVVSVGRAGSSPAPDTSAAGRHGAQRDAVTPLDPGHETPTGGDSLGWGHGRCVTCGHHSAVHFHAAPHHCLAFLDGMERSCDCPCYVEPMLRLRSDAGAVAAPGVAMEWDMTDLDGDE